MSRSLPRISIVIPSFNQADYLAETLDSILSQGYANLELLVIDGGSSDGSVEIIQRYAGKLAFHVSEADTGQTNAINKGLRRITGDVWSYLNSDDLLLPGSLQAVGEIMAANPTLRWVGGISDMFDAVRVLGVIDPEVPRESWHYLAPWRRSKYAFSCSNVTFMRRNVLDDIGLFDESYRFGMDTEYYVRAVLVGHVRPLYVREHWGRWRWHARSKSMREGLWVGFREDELRIAAHYLGHLAPGERRLLLRDLTQQQKSVAVRRANYFRHHRGLLPCFRQLVRSAVRNPTLLFYGPWLGMMARVCLLRRGRLLPAS